MRMAREIAADLEPDRFGIVALYVIGSAKNATAGPASDLDLLVHFRGSREQEANLRERLAAWSVRLAEMNCERTRIRAEGLLDVHLITDDDVAKRTSYAVMIGAATDAARPLPLKKGSSASGRTDG
jgi:predicted nucleotidyltransferase